MKSFFKKRFEEEVLSNEMLRTSILVCMALFGVIYIIINILIFHSSVIEKSQSESVRNLLLFHFALLIFEIITWLRIKYKIERQQYSIENFDRYTNSFIEICSPGIILLIMAKQYDSPVTILHAPLVYLYFIFIVLSTLRLDFKLSLFTGCMAAVGFLVISMLLIRKSQAQNSNHIFNNEYIVAFAISTALFACGIGAAFVARQIRITIDNSLTAAEEGNRIVNLFGQQISKEIVEEMLESEGALQSKMMKVCVMFVDIRDFTRYVSDKTPVEIVGYQNAFFEIVIRSVTKHHGIINQFLGDGCMVTFGAPAALKNPANNAVQAAIEIHKELKERVQKGDLAPTNIGIGIHAGDAVTGNIGTIERQQYSITGSVVILAARIEQLNKQYDSQILVSEDVVHQINDSLPCDSKFLGKVDLKGWHQSLGIYKIA
jgi:adenylate cyclase